MEDESDNIEEAFKLIKDIKNNNKEIKEKNFDSDIFNKINENSEDEKKNYFIIKHSPFYIVDKEPIEQLMEELNYDEIENDMDNISDKELKMKIKKFIKNKDIDELKDEIKEKLNIYNTEEDINDIIKNGKKVIFIKENILKSLEIPYKQYKDKEVFISSKKYIYIIYNPRQNFSLMINSYNKAINNKSEKGNKIQNNGNNTNNHLDKSNSDNEQKEEEDNSEDNKQKLNNYVQNNQNNINQNNMQNNINNINENINNGNFQINNQSNNINNNIPINNSFQINNNANNFNNNIINTNNSQNNIQINMNNININSSETFNALKIAQNAKLSLDRNLQIVYNHISFLNNIVNNLPSINIPNLNDINQIQNIHFSNKVNIILINSDIFEEVGKNLLYDECLLYFNLNENDKQQKYNELLQKINANNNMINNDQIKLIRSYDEYNINPDGQYMIINEDFCANIGMDKQQFINSSLFLLKLNNEIFLFFSDKNQLTKIYGMNKYYKICKNFGDMVETKQEIVDNLINLYKETKEFNEYLTEYELKDSSFKNYYMVNKEWLEVYKKYYNFEDICIKYEQEYYDGEDNGDDNNNDNINNNSINENNEIIGLNKKKGKNKKKNKKRNNKGKSNNNNQNRTNKNKNNVNNIKKIIKSMHKNIEIPKILFDENKIFPILKSFKEMSYPTNFELIGNQTLKNICKSLNLEISYNFDEQIFIEAMSGDDIIILKRKDNTLIFYLDKGVTNILQYIIMFENKNIMNTEINNIKQKGIKQYLIEKYLNFEDDSLQYLPNSSNTSIIGKIYICHKESIDYNINNNILYSRNSNNLNSIINNYQYINNFTYQILPCRAGLDNIGATCYMNATLQSLCNIPKLQNFFLYNNELYQRPNAILSKAFGDVMRNLYDRNKNKVSYAPKHFKEIISEMNPLFKGIAANDSKDLILFLLEKMHEELNTPINYNPDPNIFDNNLMEFRKEYYSANCSVIQQTFIHEIESKIKCCNCGFEVINYNVYNFIIFPLEKIRERKAQLQPQGFYEVNLNDCFEINQMVEYLQGDSMLYCNGCKKTCVAENYTKLNTCPDILIIILNRGKGIQYQVNFDFPMRLDLFNYVKENNNNTQYELISVIVHTGGSDMSGHFYSYCKSNIDKKWYRYNDCQVDMLDDNYQITIKNYGLPYVLFYQKTSSVNNDINMNNNIANGQITLYFKLIDIEKELYLDVNSNDIFSFVVQKLAQKYNGIYNFFNCCYYILIMNNTQLLDFNKTVQQNNLSDSSFIIVQTNK